MVGFLLYLWNTKYSLQIKVSHICLINELVDECNISFFISFSGYDAAIAELLVPNQPLILIFQKRY